MLDDNRECYKEETLGKMHWDICSIVLSSFSYYREYIDSLPQVSLKDWPWRQNCCQQSMSYKQTETSHCRTHRHRKFNNLRYQNQTLHFLVLFHLWTHFSFLWFCLPWTNSLHCLCNSLNNQRTRDEREPSVLSAPEQAQWDTSLIKTSLQRWSLPDQVWVMGTQ